MKPETIERATHMLAAIVERGETYRQVAARFGVGHSTVERQVKSLLMQVSHTRCIPGIDDPGLATLVLLRHCASAVMEAVRMVEPSRLFAKPQRRQLQAAELLAGANRLRRLSENPQRDIALLYLLFSTGAKPVEIARLQVDDYLCADGAVRQRSEWRAQAAARGRHRPLYFESARTCAALDAYLQQRVVRQHGASEGSVGFRGLDPCSALFLTDKGLPFEVRCRGDRNPRPSSSCLTGLLRRIFSRAGWRGVTAQSARQQVACRLAERGADTGQVGLLLGLTHPRSVRRLLDRRRVPIESLVKDLV